MSWFVSYNRTVPMHRVSIPLPLFLLLWVALLPVVTACEADPDDPEVQVLKEALTFYASFDGQVDADYAAGDRGVHTAPSWERRDEARRGVEEGEHLRVEPGAGVYADALWMESGYEPIFFYYADDNVAYREEDWSGTMSFWLRLDPDEDLEPGFSDPIQLTPRGWNDASLFVDFTDEPPRTFRFAIFPDRDVWDPDERDWEEVPVYERPMIDVEDHPFSQEEWTHVALSFRNFNTGEVDGEVDCYLNGELVGTLVGHEQTHTWEPGTALIWLGYNYRGYIDELAFFDRDLAPLEIQTLYLLEGGVRSILELGEGA